MPTSLRSRGVPLSTFVIPCASHTATMEGLGHLLLKLADWLEAPTTGASARYFAYGTGIAIFIVAIILIGKLAAILRRGTGAGRFATRNGWTYDGMGEYSGRVGNGSWRGGPHSDDDSAKTWTDFRASLRIDRPGACRIVDRQTWNAGEQRQAHSRTREGNESALQALDGLSPAFSQHWVFAATDPAWRSVFTGEVESLLQGWASIAPEQLSASCGSHAVELTSQADLERLFRLGEALARACVATLRTGSERTSVST